MGKQAFFYCTGRGIHWYSHFRGQFGLILKFKISTPSGAENSTSKYIHVHAFAFASFFPLFFLFKSGSIQVGRFSSVIQSDKIYFLKSVQFNEF